MKKKQEKENKRFNFIENNSIKKNSGLTLIILIITVIVLLILAGVSIHKILSDNGILSKTEDARVTNKANEISRRCKDGI